MSSQEEKINNLLERIRQGNTSSRNTATAAGQINSQRNNCDLPLPNRPNLPLIGMNNSAKKRPQVLTFTPQCNDNLETDKKLKEIMKISGNLKINDVTYQTDIKDMEDIEELGNGTCGHVVKMRHKPSNEIIAVKQMRRSGNSEENKRIIMDIEVVLKSHDCNYIVQSLGCFITDSEVWICMELMTTCFDKLLKKLGKPIPEEILGKVTVATVEALSYLKDKHRVIHRDVKPSNILVDTRGFIKLCDFGISGRLVDSMAKTRSAGCAAYLAPERIEPDPKNPDYDIRADVWSLGITMVELATGVFPYKDCNTDFEMLTKVIREDPPSLPETFSSEFRDFVKCCLIKDQKQRPKYAKLKNHDFIKKYQFENINVGEWVANAIQQADAVANRTAPRHIKAQSSVRRFFTSNPRQSQDSSQYLAQYKSNIRNGDLQPQQQQQHQHNTQINNKQQPIVKDSQQQQQQQLPPENRTTLGHVSRLSTFQMSTNNNSNNQRDNSSNQPSCTNQRQKDYSSYHQHSSPPPSSHQSDSDLNNSHLITTTTTTTNKVHSPFQAYQNHILATNTELHKKKHAQQVDAKNSIEKSSQNGDGQESKKFQQRLLDSPVNVITSPYQQRRVASESRWRSPNASPLPLRTQFNKTDHEQQYNCGNTSPIILQRFYHQQKQQQLAKEAEETGKKRFASYIKLQLSGDRSGRSSRHQSPEPPPRLNRTISSENQSPLALHRTFLDSNSPSISRRYVSPTPPIPPPRRLTESSSVPGSPQHLRTRFRYTPEPQRHLFHNNDVS